MANNNNICIKIPSPAHPSSKQIFICISALFKAFCDRSDIETRIGRLKLGMVEQQKGQK